jgi:hypothetical protein
MCVFAMLLSLLPWLEMDEAGLIESSDDSVKLLLDVSV